MRQPGRRRVTRRRSLAGSQNIWRAPVRSITFTAAARHEYDETIRQVLLFLEGKQEQVLDNLKGQMEQAAENLEFERAAALRDRVRAVEQVLEKQKIITTTGPGDQDVVALAGADDETCALVFFFRGGKLVGREYYILQGTRDTSVGEVMASFLQQFYDAAACAS